MKGFGLKELKNLGSSFLRMTNNNLPSILTGFAVCGLVATAVTAFKSAPEVNSAIKAKEWDKQQDLDPDDNEEAEEVQLTPWETFTAAAPYIWKPVVCGVFTAGCVVGAQVLNMERLAILAGAYKLSEGKLKEYETKAKEFLGEKKAEELHDEVVKELHDVPLTKSQIIWTKYGDTIFFDNWSGRHFTSSEAAIRRAESTINKAVASGDFVTLNDFYYELDLPATKPGKAFGWEMYSPSKAHVMDIRLTPDTAELDGEQRVVWIIDYDVMLDDRNFCGRL